MKNYSLFNTMGWAYGFDAAQLAACLDESEWAEGAGETGSLVEDADHTSNKRLILIALALFLLLTLPAMWAMFAIV